MEVVVRAAKPFEASTPRQRLSISDLMVARGTESRSWSVFSKRSQSGSWEVKIWACANAS
jgi:hypothetical protein